MSGLLSPCVTAALVLAAAVPARAQSWVTAYEEARPQAEKICAGHDLRGCREALLGLERLLDGRLDVEYKLARVEAQLGLDEAAVRRLGIYARSGLDRGDPGTDPAFAALKQRGALRQVLQAYRAGKRATTAHVHLASLADPNLVAEDLACEGQHRTFLVSSVRERKIVRVDPAGRVQDFVTQAQTPLWGVFALGLDSARNLLWASTASINISPPIQPGEAERSAVLALNMKSGALIARYELPRDGGARHAFGDMTVAPTGIVYVSDGLGGGVYTVAHKDASGLTTLVEPGQLASPQTPALAADGNQLLVPDYTRGIVSVNLGTRAVRWIEHPPELALFGIDGLYLDGQRLLAVQNGTTPERIVMMHLTEGLGRIDRWRVLLARAPGLGDPTHGCLLAREFYFIANSGWDQFQDDGAPIPNSHPTPAQIWKIAVPPI